MARLTLDLPIRDTTSPKAMEMVVTPMAIGTMVETRETTSMEAMVTKMEEMDITMETMVTRMEEMETTMETMVSTTTTQKLRRISRISHASIARRKDTIPQTAQRISLMNLPSPIHSRKDM
jgi:mevalonate kinase